MTTKTALESMAADLGNGARVYNHSDYYVIANYSGSQYWCDENDNPFACWRDSNTAAGTSRDTTEIKPSDNATVDDVPEDTTGETKLDIEGMTLVLPDIDLSIGDITYNSNNKTYNIFAYKYDITNNYYYTYNYSWTYHVNYTSITYIGQSEEYDRTYEVYYELPDGRSSADLTAEELEQLNLSVDVINYGRSADDTRLRSLYHFDGTTDDSSYWNYATAFTWNKGASLTYLESGNFNGALYLDETEHDFTLTLPSNIGSREFTLQFRYYQSATVAPQLDSYIRFGDSTLMQFNGSQILDGSGAALATMPVGSWNEIAIMRVSDRSGWNAYGGGRGGGFGSDSDDNSETVPGLHFYLNGVQIGAAANTTPFADTVSFHFGSEQQTYKELDELRILNYALATDGANYTPTSVPYDTNLALVLPDSVAAVADEYWNINSPGAVYSLRATDESATVIGTGGYMYNETYANVEVGDSFSVSNVGAKNTGRYLSGGYYWYNGGTVNYSYPNYGIAVPLAVYAADWYKASGYWYYQCAGIKIDILKEAQNDVEYYCHIVGSDGKVYSLKFKTAYYTTYDPQYNYPDGYRNDRVITLASASFDWGELSYVTSDHMGAESNHRYKCETSSIVITPKDGETFEFVYFDISTSDEITAEFVSGIQLLNSDDLNTPTLAIRSDIPVTNYQIGGVRPSIPSRGQVWAQVESGYITSLQIYDGRAWVACDGRIWTGERWIPYSAYNVVTLSDMYDIADASGQSGYEYIYTEPGFWSWFQKQWLSFRQWTGDMLEAVKSGGGSSGGDSMPLSESDVDSFTADEWDFVEDDHREDITVITVVKSVGGGAWQITKAIFGTALNILNNLGKAGQVLGDTFDQESDGYAFGYFYQDYE